MLVKIYICKVNKFTKMANFCQVLPFDDESESVDYTFVLNQVPYGNIGRTMPKNSGENGLNMAFGESSIDHDGFGQRRINRIGTRESSCFSKKMSPNLAPPQSQPMDLSQSAPCKTRNPFEKNKPELQLLSDATQLWHNSLENLYYSSIAVQMLAHGNQKSSIESFCQIYKEATKVEAEINDTNLKITEIQRKNMDNLAALETHLREESPRFLKRNNNLLPNKEKPLPLNKDWVVNIAKKRHCLQTEIDEFCTEIAKFYKGILQDNVALISLFESSKRILSSPATKELKLEDLGLLLHSNNYSRVDENKPECNQTANSSRDGCIVRSGEPMDLTIV